MHGALTERQVISTEWQQDVMWLQAQQLVSEFLYLPGYHGDNVYPHHFSAHFACTYTSTTHMRNCMPTGRHVDFKQLDFHVCFLALLLISPSFFLDRMWLSFSTEVLSVTPHVLEIMYLYIWRVSLLWCPPFFSIMPSITYPYVCECECERLSSCLRLVCRWKLDEVL